jgi:hypothetical protein
MQLESRYNNPPPPLGDHSTKGLTRLGVDCWLIGRLPERLTSRGASHNEVRCELQRRESLGVGVPR